MRVMLLLFGNLTDNVIEALWVVLFIWHHDLPLPKIRGCAVPFQQMTTSAKLEQDIYDLMEALQNFDHEKPFPRRQVSVTLVSVPRMPLCGLLCLAMTTSGILLVFVLRGKGPRHCFGQPTGDPWVLGFRKHSGSFLNQCKDR